MGEALRIRVWCLGGIGGWGGWVGARHTHVWGSRSVGAGHEGGGFSQSGGAGVEGLWILTFHL